MCCSLNENAPHTLFILKVAETVKEQEVCVALLEEVSHSGWGAWVRFQMFLPFPFSLSLVDQMQSLSY